ncbi:hypothetical protein ACP70R_005749 [Stipagrostis hirtigluma subsp. patula]
MTYNVWSCEHVAVYRRIQSICEIVDRHEPDVIFLQEVNDYIYSLFQEASWWVQYSVFTSREEKQSCSWSSESNSTPFCVLLSKLCAGEVVLPKYSSSSEIGSPPPRRPPRAARIPSDLLSAWVHETEAKVPGGFVLGRHRLRAATCCLAGPTPSDIGSTHRRARAGAFLEHFDVRHEHYGTSFVLDGNVVLGGDLGWDDDLDGPLRLGDGWVDAWSELRGGGGGDEGGGWTYDAAVANPMLRGLARPERRRSDRFICKLRDFKLDTIEMVGVEPIPGVTRFDDKGVALPVLPSHHFGLLLTVAPKH